MPPGFPPPGVPLPATVAVPQSRFVPAQNAQSSSASPSTHSEHIQPGHFENQRPDVQVRQPVLTLPDPGRSQTNPEFKKSTDLKVKDANFSPVRLSTSHACQGSKPSTG
jgi:hypothetical protein